MPSRTAELDRLVDAIATMHGVETRLGEIARQLAGWVEHGCLFTGVVVFDATGVYTADWRQGFASVLAVNHGTAEVMLSTDSAQGSAPSGGVGTALVEAGSGLIVGLDGHTLTAYGTPGERLTLAVYSRPLPPALGAAVGGGGAGGTGDKSAPAAAAVGPTATTLLAANPLRRSATFANVGPATVFLGGAGVAAPTGIPVAAGQTLSDDTSVDEWEAVTAAGTADVRVLEVSG